MGFATSNTMKFKSKLFSEIIVLGPSRKDDMISMMYLLIYLKKGAMPWTHMLQNELKVAFKEI